MSVSGGKSQGVYVVSDAEIASGAFRVAPGPAIRVTGMATATRGVEGGPAIPVYVVNDPTARGVEGGKPIPMSNLTGIRLPIHDLAIPIYVVEDDGQFTPPGPWWDEWWLGHGIDGEDFIAVYQGKGAPTFDDSLTNIANPGVVDLVPAVNPNVVALGGQAPRAETFDTALGWTFCLNGTSQYDASGYFETLILPFNNYGMMVRCNRQAGAASICSIAGSRGSGTERFMFQHASTTSTFYSPRSGGLNITGVSNLGDSTFAFFGLKCYKNGLLIGTAPAGTIASVPIILNGRMNPSGLNDGGITGSMKAFIVTGAIAPSDAEVLALHNAMMAL